MVTVIQSWCELCAVPCMVERRGTQVYMVTVWGYTVCTWSQYGGTLCVHGHSMGVHCVYMVTVWGYTVCTWSQYGGTLCVHGHSMGVHCVYMVTVWGYTVCMWSTVCIWSQYGGTVTLSQCTVPCIVERRGTLKCEVSVGSTTVGNVCWFS